MFNIFFAQNILSEHDSNKILKIHMIIMIDSITYQYTRLSYSILFILLSYKSCSEYL